MFIGRGIGVCGGRDGEQNINHQGWFLCAMHTLIQAQAPGFSLVNNGGPSTYLSRFLTNVFFFCTRSALFIWDTNMRIDVNRTQYNGCEKLF